MPSQKPSLVLPGISVNQQIMIAFFFVVLQGSRMGLPQHPVTLTPEQIGSLNGLLADMRHNVNNCLQLVMAATEIVARKPELAERYMGNLINQSRRITAEMMAFSDHFEAKLGITRE